MRYPHAARLTAVTLAAFSFAAPALAEKLRIALPQKGVWETSITIIGMKAGFFEKEGLELDVLHTRGGSETVQAVLAGSVDMAHSNGILGTIGGYEKGAPLRIIGAAATGGADLFWYVPADSPIKSVADISGRKIGYSQAGSSTNLMVLSLLAQNNIKAQPVASGGPSGSYTMTMSKQIDIGWSSPPFGLKEITEGKIRIVARGSDIKEIEHQTVRVNIARADILISKRDTLFKYQRAWLKALDYCYSNDNAIDAYAAFANVSKDIARETRDKFEPKSGLLPYEIGELELSLKQAYQYKFTSKLLRREDVKGLIDILAKR